MPTVSLHPNNQHTQSQPSLQPPAYDPSATSRSEPPRSPINVYSRPSSTSTSRPSVPARIKPKPATTSQKIPNLDYLSFGNEPEPTPTTHKPAPPIKTEPTPTDWERLLGSLDNGDTNIYDACYGGPPIDALLDTAPLSMHNNHSTPVISNESIAWSSDSWALCPTETNSSLHSGLTPSTGQADSIVSFSTDDGGSGSDHDFAADWNSGSVNSNSETFKGIVMPQEGVDYGNNWDSGLLS